MASLALSSSSSATSRGFRSLRSISSLRSRRSLARARNPLGHGRRRTLVVRALTLDFTGSFFEEGGDEEGDGSSSGPSAAAAAAAVLEDKEEPQCPPGLRQYETMAVLRPDMNEDERLALIQRYEEIQFELADLVDRSSFINTLLVAGGGMYVEVFNRGVIPLAYSIKKKNKAGETNTYLDGIYLLFTFFTKPESVGVLETRLKADDDVIRSSTFKVRKRKY